MSHYSSRMEDVDFVSASVDLACMTIRALTKDIMKLAKCLLSIMCDYIADVIHETVYWWECKAAAIFCR